MDDCDFVDSNGTVWRVFAGLPAEYPNTGDMTADGKRGAGLTFRASTGEVRVLPQWAIPRRVQVPEPPNALGTRVPTARVEAPDWRVLLQHALVWPPA